MGLLNKGNGIAKLNLSNVDIGIDPIKIAGLALRLTLDIAELVVSLNDAGTPATATFGPLRKPTLLKRLDVAL